MDAGVGEIYEESASNQGKWGEKQEESSGTSSQSLDGVLWRITHQNCPTVVQNGHAFFPHPTIIRAKLSLEGCVLRQRQLWVEADPELAELDSESFWKKDPHGTLLGLPQEHANSTDCAVT